MPPRPSLPGREDPDPLGPRRIHGDSDVPEPEQLPPLESERTAPVESHTQGPAAARDAWSAPTERPGAGADGSAEHPGTSPSRPGPPPLGSLGRPSWSGPRDLGDEAASRDTPAPARRTDYEAGMTADALNAATLVRNRNEGPTGGWRRAVHTASMGLINPGESPKVLRERELVARATTPVATGHHRVAVLSLKGGVGKTTTTVALGATLASLRGDRVLAVDANPDRGTLSDKVRLETAATIRDLLNERHLVSRYADIRGFTSQAPSRLEILASDRDPAVSEAFSDDDYREVARIVEHFYSICLTDCGTGLLHSAMRGVLGLADQVVLVSSASVDGARSASATLDWLEAHGHGSLVAGAVVVLSMVRSNSKSSVDLDRLEEHFAGRCRSVVRVPWDGHLEEGAEVDLDRLAPATRDSYLQLAANVGEAFAR
ncbi:MinD/ParA family protein [Nocardiopsis sp. MG754419]|nr:MinD/ParA family protein [Nocardiopsis sp. MG754419]